ncbi:MAG: hypothetical protein EPO02_03590 [Nitrospirae bacterium]|nr:MAG: hypothetical protein EPO02_03590 [Nitrospirota bacterium]
MVKILMAVFFVGVATAPVEAHEMRQPIPILLDRMYGVLLLLEQNKTAEAIYQIGTVEELLQTKGLLGLTQTAAKLDQAYRTTVAESLGAAIAARDAARLKSAIYSLTYLLMLEKLDQLTAMLPNRDVRPDTRKVVMDLARDYFSHIFEETFGRRRPAQVKTMEQILDRMDGAVRQQAATQFEQLRRQLSQAVLSHFAAELLPGLPG